METILVSIVSMALIVVASVTMAISNMQSTGKIADSWKQMAATSTDISRTDIVAVAPQHYTGGNIELVIKNDGQTNLSDFAKWDIIVQYASGGVTYLAYSPAAPPEENQWTVKGIFITGDTPEVFDLNVLNPGEEMIMSMVLNPEINVGQACRITISTPNGVKSQVQMIRE